MNKHIGSDFDDFLAEQGIAEEVSAAALKRVIAWQIAEAMKHQKVTKRPWHSGCTPVALLLIVRWIRTMRE